MSKIATFLFSIALLFAASGCGGGESSSADAGRDAWVATVDAGTDAAAGDAAAPLDSSIDAARAADTGVQPDSSVLAAVDGGNPFGDAGAAGPPAWVSIDVVTSGACPALTPCGGDLIGTWDVSGACVEVPIGDALAACPGASIERSVGMARGRVIFDGTTARRIAQSEVDVDIFVPAICASFVGGCDGIATRIRAVTPDSACLTTTLGDCNCSARQITAIDNTDLYSISGNEIVGTVSGKRWAFCVGDGSFSYEDTSPAGPREPGIIHLTMR